MRLTLVLVLAFLMKVAAQAQIPANLPLHPLDSPSVVRVVYLVSADRKENPEYTEAIRRAMLNIQHWFASRLSGNTFRLASDTIVEIAHSNKPAAWFYETPNGENPSFYGYNNGFDEAKRLLGASFFDPSTTWVIYSDGPGNGGAGGSGVTVMPEDDLLGLTAQHPTQKDTNRWIAGLGHELGHAFGLGHPEQPELHKNAIMWTGIYAGRYPDSAYLTEEDSIRLIHSPFFYTPSGHPVHRLTELFNFDGGRWEHHIGLAGDVWLERKTENNTTFTFREVRRDDDLVVVYDTARKLWVRLPIAGGTATISTDGRYFHDLMSVQPLQP